jgi:replication initiation protein RepC
MYAETGAQGAQRENFAGHPTGFRRLTPSLLRADRTAEGFSGLPEGVTQPGQLLAALKAAAPRLGVGPRLIHAVDWLFRFTQPQDWGQGARPIVWPSAAMQQEALGLSPTRVKAINRVLIDAGLITMKDSPNGKRYGKRDGRERIVEAYGFDLSPIAARHAEFVALAEEARLEREAVRRLRRRATIARKGIAQVLETVAEYGLADDVWETLARDSAAIVRALKDVTRPEEMEQGVGSLERRQNEGRRQLEVQLKVVDSVPKGAENGPHITTTTESLNPMDTVIAQQTCSFSGGQGGSQPSSSTPSEGAEPEKVLKLRPGELARLAPRLQSYLRGSEPSWPDIVDAADRLRHDLDISKALWGEACFAMGREVAALALAIVSTKDPAHFRTTPGGYFHGMVGKHKAGALNLDRTIWGLRRAAEPSGTDGQGQGPRRPFRRGAMAVDQVALSSEG